MNNNMPKATFGMWPNDEEYENDGNDDGNDDIDIVRLSELAGLMSQDD